MGIVIALLSFAAAPIEADAPESYLRRVEQVLELCGKDIAAMQPVAEAAAGKLAAGGMLWAAGQPSWVSEISGRAGGMMMIRALGGKAPAADDVVLYAPVPGDGTPDSLRETQAYVIGFGPCDDTKGTPCFPNHAEAAHVSPTLANAVPAWLFTGELIAALTRVAKMPVIYESIGGYGGFQRIAQYKNGEIAFHDDKHVAPVPAGIIAKAFVDTVSAMLRRVEKEQRANLDRAGAWAREAKAQDKQMFMYSMGHLFPDEVGKTDIGRVFRSATWNAGFRGAVPNDPYAQGDLVVHVGYQQPPDDLLRRARPAGARVVYVAVRPDRDYVQDPGVIWLDPMWNWLDACVPLEGYDLPLLAASGIVNGAIAWEIFRLTLPNLASARSVGSV